MLNVRRAALLAAILAVIAGACYSLSAVAAGYFPGFPIAGGPSYCGGYSSYPTTATTPGTLATPNNCNVTVPAGNNLSGLEIVPMDTQAAQGVAPQTQGVRICQLGGGAATYNSPPGGTTTATVPDNTCYYIFNGTTTISSFTLTMPPNPIDGQLLDIASDTTISTLTLSANTTVTSTQAIKNAPTALTLSTTAPYNYRFIYRAADTAWHRVQ